MSTKIEWAEETWNPVTGCTKISPGCAHCYAERMAKRLAGRAGYPKDNPFAVTFHPDRLDQPLRWRKPRRIFVCSMGDLFHEDVGNHWRDAIWQVMRKAEQHTFLVLTKRPQAMLEYYHRAETLSLPFFPLTHIWLGVTAENQEQADWRIPVLLSIPAAVRFVSVEPMLRAVDLERYLMVCGDCGNRGSSAYVGYTNDLCQRVCIKRGEGPALNWVICGGESGPGARPMHPDWVRSLRDQCKAATDYGAGVPFLFKQWGKWAPAGLRTKDAQFYGGSFYNDPRGGKIASGSVSRSGRWTIWPDGNASVRVGKKAAGRELDGETWDQYPEVKA